MGKRGFSATTLVLVAVLVGALFMVGKTVIPPPPGPPQPPPQPKAPTAKPLANKGGPSAEERAKILQKMDSEKARAMKYRQLQEGNKPKFDPNGMDITSNWHKTKPMGDAGNKYMRDMVRKAKLEQAAHPRVPVTPAALTPQPTSAPKVSP